MKRFVLVACFFLIACTPQATEERPAPSHELVVYATKTPGFTSTPNLVINVETPVPTSTPFTYTVKSGDTLSRIADHFHISLDALQLANPDVSPNGLAVGTVLQIPSDSTGSSSASTPTPVPVPVTQTSCYPTADRGMWCFALVRNDSPAALDNVSAQITLMDAEGSVIASQVGLTPLDILPPNTALPIYVFFPPEIPANATAQVQLLSAVTLTADDARYLPAMIQNSSAQIDWDGRFAQVSGLVSLPAESKAATTVWVAAVAYDKNGQVVGVKRWEGGGLQPGGALEFQFAVASLGSAIDAVEFTVEARP